MTEETLEKTGEEKVEIQPEKNESEKLRESILKEGEEPVESLETKPEEIESKEKESEEEIVEGDWDDLMTKYPDIAGLVKDSKDPLTEILSRYSGGLKDLTTASQFNAELKKLGYDTPEKRENLFQALKSGAVSPGQPDKTQIPQTFKEQRKAKLLELLPQTRKNEMDEDIVIPEQERQEMLKNSEAWAESILPSNVVETVNDTQGLAMELMHKLEFELFRLQPILEEYKDKLIDPKVYYQVNDFFKPLQYMAKEIIATARKENRQYFPALYEYMMFKTQGNKVVDEKVQQALAEKEKELRKKADAKTLELKGKGKSLETEKQFDKMNLTEKRRHIIVSGE